MRVLSLFDGISGTQQALKNLGIEPEVYYASEIDKYAIAITMKNFPNTIQLGDVTKVNKDMLKSPIKLMTWGSPCQDLSIAKKDRKGLSGERSGLFWEAIRIWKEVQPEYWIMENVASMPKADRDIITKELGVEPILINSSLLTAQQRKRLYWTNIPNITQPEDLKIYLKDIIETGEVDKLKSYCIDASYYKGTNLETYLKKAKRQVVFENPDFIAGVGIKRLEDGKELSRNYKQGNRIYSDLGKTPTLVSNIGGIGGPTGMFILKAPNQKNIEIPTNSDLCVFKEVRTEEGKKFRKEYRKLTGRDTTKRGINDKKYVPATHNKANCITTSIGIEGLIYDPNTPKEFCIRKLTPIECERLQSFPDSYTEKGIMNDKEVSISNTQRYKCLGNSFTVKVIEHILSFIGE